MWDEGSVVTLAGSGLGGFKDGQGTEARFHIPYGVAVDPSGQVIVTAWGNVRCIDSRGEVSTLAGSPGISGDGWAAFDFPSGLAVAEDGTVLVADCSSNQIRKIVLGEVSIVVGIFDFMGSFKDGSHSEACFSYPCSLALDGADSIIVADADNHRIRRVTPQGVTTLAGNGQEGNQDGPAQEASFKRPWAVAVGPNGHLMATDLNGRLCLLAEGRVSTVATGFKYPSGLLVDCRGNAIVADTNNHRIVFCTVQGAVTVIAGNGNRGFKDGPSGEASFKEPCGLAMDHQGRVVVADRVNNRVRALTLPSTLRLREELALLMEPRSSPLECPRLPEGCSVTRSTKSLFQWSAVLRVAKGPFRGQSFELSLQMAFDYPVSGPLVKFVGDPPCHPNVDSVSGEVFFPWSYDQAEDKPQTIRGVLETIQTLLCRAEELVAKEVVFAEQALARIGSKGLFERQSTYDRRVAERGRALEAAKGKLAAIKNSAEARDGSVEFWSRKLEGVLNQRDIAEAASKLSAANFKQRHWGEFSRDELKEAGLTQGVAKDLMRQQALGNTTGAPESSPLPPVIVHAPTTSGVSLLLQQCAAHLPRILDSELVLGRVLGKGSYSEVRSAVWTRTITVGRQQASQVAVAVKLSRVNDGGGDDASSSLVLSADMARDLAVISNLPHQNILTVHGVCESSTRTPHVGVPTLKVVYELMSIDLAKLLARCEQQRLPTKLLLRVLRDVSSGLAHLHHHKVLHGDVKPANVLLRRGNEQSLLVSLKESSEPSSPSSSSSCFKIEELQQFEQVKLCDFGSSKDLQQSLLQMSHRVGSWDYMAPEMLHKELVGEAADVWSFGVVLFQCATGKLCGVKTPMAELKAELLKVGCGEELVKVFEQCHQMEQKERPKMAVLHEELQLLVMRSINDEHTLRQELKRAVAQDLETYNATWDKHYATQPAMPNLLLCVAQLARDKPATRVVRQPLSSLVDKGGKKKMGSLVELEQLASSCVDRLHSQLGALVESCGGTYVRDRKSFASANRKVSKDYKGDYSLLLDLERATGLFEEASNMLLFLQRLLATQQQQQQQQQAGMLHFLQRLLTNQQQQATEEGLVVTVLRCKDKLNRPMASGYRDVLLNVCDVDSGFVAELQLNFHKIAEIRGYEHRIYQLTRALDLPWVM